MHFCQYKRFATMTLLNAYFTKLRFQTITELYDAVKCYNSLCNELATFLVQQTKITVYAHHKKKKTLHVIITHNYLSAVSVGSSL